MNKWIDRQVSNQINRHDSEDSSSGILELPLVDESASFGASGTSGTECKESSKDPWMAFIKPHVRGSGKLAR